LRLYQFRLNEDIEVRQVLKVAENVGRVLGVDFTLFSRPIARPPDELTLDDLMAVSDAFLERGEPVVALAFTRTGVADDEAILGQGSEAHRGAYVLWRDDIRETTLNALHGLGHVCDADHCTSQDCLMFPTYWHLVNRELNLKELFCERTLGAIQSSWVYTRLTYASQDRLKKSTALPRIIEDSPNVNPSKVAPARPVTVSHSPQVPIGPVAPRKSDFPDWNLADSDPDEFVRLVKEHFGFRR